jgi:hypothetical protein
MNGMRNATAFVAALLIGMPACRGESGPRPYRAASETMKFRITPDPSPPIAREPTLYKVVVQDKESNQPIEGGEGRIFAESRDGARTFYPLTPGPELGTYYGTLRYVLAGEWAVAIQFRRDSTDSTSAIERIDWMQEVQGSAAEAP